MPAIDMSHSELGTESFASGATLELFAGNMGGSGYVNGIGGAARFGRPVDVAADGAGNVYVADSDNATIRKITPAGVVSTLAGTPGVYGYADGTGTTAIFRSPLGVATDGAGNVYVADYGNAVIRKITPTGVVSTLAGTPGAKALADGKGAAASFWDIVCIATDSAGNVYAADHGTIRKITPAGVVSTLAGTAGVKGCTDGTGAVASFHRPLGIVTDRTGNIYVACGNHTIRKITPAGVVSTLAGTTSVEYGEDEDGMEYMEYVGGCADGTGATASFDDPFGVATDCASNVYVTDSHNNTIRKITPAGVVSTLAGTAGVEGSADGTGPTASFNNPRGIATDSAGNVYVADSDNATIRKITPAGIVSTLVGVPGSANFVAGVLPGMLGAPRGIAVHGTTLYVTCFHGVAIVRNVDSSRICDV